MSSKTGTEPGRVNLPKDFLPYMGEIVFVTFDKKLEMGEQFSVYLRLFCCCWAPWIHSWILWRFGMLSKNPFDLAFH